jgi:3-oxoacyl-[acyl-carrier-protein] synthase-3
MFAAIRAVAYHLPEATLSNEALAAAFPDWPADKIAGKVGIRIRHLAAPGECASDLAAAAARKLFATGVCAPQEIDFLLFCTQAPDYFLPTTACVLQERLGLPTAAGALDFNLGCSGFVYGLGLAKGLIETGQASNVLLLTGETYSKFLDPADRGSRALFGDAAAATLVQGRPDPAPGGVPWIGPFVYGSDGKGKSNLIVAGGGLRQPAELARLFMNGPEIFTFTLRAVPQAVRAVLAAADKTTDDIDLFVFHQANRYMLEHLRDKMKLPPEKFVVAMEDCGNTVSSTIPIALHHVADRLPGRLAMLVGFGVGYSWGAALVRWPG